MEQTKLSVQSEGKRQIQSPTTTTGKVMLWLLGAVVLAALAVAVVALVLNQQQNSVLIEKISSLKQMHKLQHDQTKSPTASSQATPALTASTQSATTVSPTAINISYSAYNELEGNETQFWAGVLLSGQPKPFVQFMDEAALVNPELRYNATHHPVYGTFVDAINGVYGRLGETYWAFLMMQHNGTLCYMQVGVSTFVPSNGDHIIFQYVGYDFSATSC